jgi:hypothetical protein
MEKWMLPPAAMPQQQGGFSNAMIEAKYVEPRASETLPDLLGTLGTMRKRFYALNYGTIAASSPPTSSNGARVSGSGGRRRS